MRTTFIGLALALALSACAPATAWTWTPAALEELKAVAQAAPAEGLPSEQAALDELTRFAEQARTDPTASSQQDIASDALFDSLARSFAQGALDPARADPDWAIDPPPAPDLAALHTALANGASPAALLRELLPQSAEYQTLRTELARVASEAPGARDANGLVRETRLQRLRANLERWRWLPRDLPARRIEIRVAQAEAILRRPDASVATHIAIVGAQDSPTPTFAAEIRSITLNPSWTPPSSILHNELLPRFRRDPAAADREGFDVVDSQGALVAPASVDWAARPFPYQLRQRPGPNNALGGVRFDLPNRFAVYLHDTPNRALFARDRRTFSHGCIRVDDPVGLAEAVLEDPVWTRESLQAAIDPGAPHVIAVAPPLSIYVLYLTASVQQDGAIAYFDDVYGLDEVLVAQMDAPDIALVTGRPSHARCAAA